MLNHTGKKSINCNKCDYACYRAPDLRKHLMINSEEKPHKCNQCENTFALKDSLKIHLKCHSGEKSFKCDQYDCLCDGRNIEEPQQNSFWWKIIQMRTMWLCISWLKILEAGNLRRHSKIHSGEKPYKCNQCHFASAHAYKLKYHLKTHSGENLSNVAYVSFLLSRQMVWPNIWKLTLEKSHTGVTNNQCDYTSIRADYLRKHLRSHPVWRQYNIIWQQTVKGHFSKSTREKIFQE